MGVVNVACKSLLAIALGTGALKGIRRFLRRSPPPPQTTENTGHTTVTGYVERQRVGTLPPYVLSELVDVALRYGIEEVDWRIGVLDTPIELKDKVFDRVFELLLQGPMERGTDQENAITALADAVLPSSQGGGGPN